MTNRTDEFAVKRARIGQLIEQRGLKGLLLMRSANWSWATCGREANIATNSESAVAALLFTPERDYLLANRIEMPRMLGEELRGADGNLVLPFESVEYAWYEQDRLDVLATELAGGPWGADVKLQGAQNLADDVAALRWDLLPAEQERFRALGRATGTAIEAAARAIEPGMTEHEIAGVLANETFRQGAFPVVTLVATDERTHTFRHPPATAKRLERYALLVICARQYGLVTSSTRLVHFGAVPDELLRRAAACARVDNAVHAATRPGRTLGEVFSDLEQAYAAEGFAGEWRDHHQGGMAGYENREVLGTPAATTVVRAGQAYAWNPSIAGVKSEDTIIIGEVGYEVITVTGDWPTIDGGRPGILVR